MKKISKRQRPGIVLLGLVVVIAIMALLYSMQLGSFFGGRQRRANEPKADRPWLDEERIVGENEIIALGEAPKPQFSGWVRKVGAVSFNGEPRGEIKIDISPSGEVSGSWQCKYSADATEYAYAAKFAGNVDSGVDYVDEDGEIDESRLYLITKGDYVKGTFNTKSGHQESEKGLIYVVGFIRPDMSADGRITITTDKKWSATYLWEW